MRNKTQQKDIQTIYAAADISVEPSSNDGEIEMIAGLLHTNEIHRRDIHIVAFVSRIDKKDIDILEQRNCVVERIELVSGKMVVVIRDKVAEFMTKLSTFQNPP